MGDPRFGLNGSFESVMNTRTRKGEICSDFPFSGTAPSERNDPLRSNAKGDSRPLSRSPHADLKVGSDLDCPGAPDLKQEIDTLCQSPVSFFMPGKADAARLLKRG